MPAMNVAVELGELLGSTVEAVAQAQDRLDDFAELRRREYEEAVPDALKVPPVWYTFRNVSLELELSAGISSSVEGSGPAAGAAAPGGRLLCRTLNPTSVGLYGYQASAGLRVRLQLSAASGLDMPGRAPIPVPAEVQP